MKTAESQPKTPQEMKTQLGRLQPTQTRDVRARCLLTINHIQLKPC